MFTYEQKFNSLNDGDLNGQDNWSGDTDFDVQQAITYEGAKAVKLAKVGGAGGESITNDSMGDVSDGIMYIACRVSTNSATENTMNLRPRYNLGTALAIRFAWGGIEYQVSGGSYTAYSSYNANQWYVLAIEWDNSGHSNQFRINVHDGTSWGGWTDWVTSNFSFAHIDGLTIICYSVAESHDVYFDTITPNDPTIKKFVPKAIIF